MGNLCGKNNTMNKIASETEDVEINTFGILKNDNIKILLIGPKDSGKTCLKNVLLDKYYTDEYSPTIGFEYNMVTHVIDGIKNDIQIWDLEGGVKYLSIFKRYIHYFTYVCIVYNEDNELEEYDNLIKNNKIYIKNIKDAQYIKKGKTYELDVRKIDNVIELIDDLVIMNINESKLIK